MKTLVVIPCYNHEKLCNQLLSNINNHHILIIDDCSSNILSIQKNNNHIKVYRNKTNKGKGYCIKYAANYALTNSFTHILVIDADLQHDPSKIDDFINNANDHIFVYGKRNFRNPMPIIRRFSNYLTSFIISIYCKKWIYDSQCGYRLYNLKIFKNLNSKEDGYLFESEILLKKINKNSSIKHVDIPTIYNKGKSYINNINDTLKFIRLIVNNIF